ncbi:MAG: 4Fe-4S dicluster domain-containing protein, partial [Thiobacillaceae bacterium]
ISLSELESGFVVTPLTERGQAVIALLNLSPAADALLEEVRVQEHDAMGKQTRSLPAHSLSQVLLNCLEHPRWDDVAMRCLACGNCTAVCPTCFCHRQEAQPELGNHATAAIRKWDSCFGEDHGQIHGFQVRPDTRSRYRQWLVHKLDTWHGQFGRSGCVGCGRCMTWCPVGIDLTEEVAALTEKR